MKLSVRELVLCKSLLLLLHQTILFEIGNASDDDVWRNLVGEIETDVGGLVSSKDWRSQDEIFDDKRINNDDCILFEGKRRRRR